MGIEGGNSLLVTWDEKHVIQARNSASSNWISASDAGTLKTNDDGSPAAGDTSERRQTPARPEVISSRINAPPPNQEKKKKGKHHGVTGEENAGDAILMLLGGPHRGPLRRAPLRPRCRPATQWVNSVGKILNLEPREG